MKLITITTIDFESNNQGMALVYIITDEMGTRVLMNGMDQDNTKGLLGLIGATGDSMRPADG